MSIVIVSLVALGFADWLVMPWAAKSKVEAKADHKELEEEAIEARSKLQSKDEAKLLEQRIGQNEKATEERGQDIKVMRQWMWELVKDKRARNGP